MKEEIMNKAGKKRMTRSVQITSVKVTRILVPISVEEFRQNIRPLARKIALMIFEEDRARLKNQGLETPESAIDNRLSLNSVQCGVQRLYSATAGQS
jgi:hypothetical protein